MHAGVWVCGVGVGSQVYIKQDQEFFFLSTVFRYIVYVLYEALFSSRKKYIL